MNLSKETWELIVEGLQSAIQAQREQIADLEFDLQKRYEDGTAIRKELIDKCNEVTELKHKIADYEMQDKIEHFIKQMGRRYTVQGLSWERLFYILYPSADKDEYSKKGKAKQAIQNLLRARDLGFDEGGTIFRQH